MEDDSVTIVDLTPDKSLLNPKFDGYKLSLDHLSVYSQSLSTAAAEHQASKNQYTLHQVKLFSNHNNLHSDPWLPEDTVYFIDKNQQIVQVNFKEFQFTSLQAVFQLPKNPYIRDENHFPVNIHFPTPEHAVVADGYNTLFLLHTSNRKEAQTWKMLMTDDSFCEENSGCFYLRHSCSISEQRIDCLLLNFNETKANEKKKISTNLLWITLESDDSQHWIRSRIRKLSGFGILEYAALSPCGKSVCIAGSSKFSFTDDSLQPITKEVNEHCDSEPEIYIWNQTISSLSIGIRLEKPATKKDISVECSSSQLSVRIHDSLVIEGEFFSPVDSECCTWTLSNASLDIMLEKKEEMLWTSLFKGGYCKLPGDELHSQADELPQSLQHLEACDAPPEDLCYFYVIDGETHKITTQINLSGYQWLFTTQREAGLLPAFCLRYDVDGIVLQPQFKSNKWEFQHILTFNCLGYIQASKQQRRYSGCSPTGSFAAVCDYKQHVYVYHQPQQLESCLRNRKTGQTVQSVARQQIVNLESPSTILGFVATTDKAFVLTSSVLYLIKVQQS